MPDLFSTRTTGRRGTHPPTSAASLTLLVLSLTNLTSFSTHHFAFIFLGRKVINAAAPLHPFPTLAYTIVPLVFIQHSRQSPTLPQSLPHRPPLHIHYSFPNLLMQSFTRTSPCFQDYLPLRWICSHPSSLNQGHSSQFSPCTRLLPYLQ